MSVDLVDGALPRAIALTPTDDEWRGTMFPAHGSPITLAMSASDLLLAVWGRKIAADPGIAGALACVDLS